MLIEQAFPRMGWGAVVLSRQPLLQNPALTAMAKANQVLIHHILQYQAQPASSDIPPERGKKLICTHIFFNDVPHFMHFLGGEISTLILRGEDAKLCLNTLCKAKTIPLPREHKTKIWRIPAAEQVSPGALRGLGSCADPNFCPEPQAARQRLQLLRKQECAARCLAGSWLVTAIGAESSLSASTLILINRSTATVPP